MIATLRRLLLVASGAVVLSASGMAQVSTDASKAVSQANAAYAQSDYAEALRWYGLAAAQGVAQAQHNLGVMYERGQGVPQNDAEAVRWYRLAAAQGFAQAQLNLGVMYYNGQGVTQNYVEAYKWWSLAAAQDNRNATKNRDIVRTEMTPAQVAEGQRLVAAWRPK